MEKLSIILLCMFASILVSCKKETGLTSINVKVSSDAVSHESTRFSYHLDEDIVSSCTPELIHIVGDVVIHINSVEKSDGRHKIVQLRYNNIRGVGLTTGDNYFLIGQQTEHFNVDFSDQSKYDLHARFTLKAPGNGSGTTFIIDYTFRRTFDSQGELVFEKGAYTAFCQ
jgi:hypothetical protein